MSAVINISPPSSTRDKQPSGSSTLPSPLPGLLHTPLGLALVELQGNINHPTRSENNSSSTVPVGRLVFPDHRGETGDGPWTKRVWLYVGEHQRLTGEVKKMGTPLGVLRRKKKKGEGSGVGGEEGRDGDVVMGEAQGEELPEELEIAEIIRWKIIFSSRPDPVGLRTVVDTE